MRLCPNTYTCSLQVHGRCDWRGQSSLCLTTGFMIRHKWQICTFLQVHDCCSHICKRDLDLDSSRKCFIPSKPCLPYRGRVLAISCLSITNKALKVDRHVATSTTTTLLVTTASPRPPTTPTRQQPLKTLQHGGTGEADQGQDMEAQAVHQDRRGCSRRMGHHRKLHRKHCTNFH